MQNGLEKLFIGGQRVAPSSGNYYDLVNPTTGETIAHVAQGNEKDVARSVAEARSAQQKWRDTPFEERSAILSNLADSIEQRAKRLAILDTHDAGKPIKYTKTFDAPQAARRFKYGAVLTHLIDQPEDRWTRK